MAALLLACVVTCRAVIIGPFPGLDKAIEQSDAIAIIRIDRHIQASPGPDLMSKHECYVYQCLKGDLSRGQVVPMSLYDMELASSFPQHSVHLVFLKARGGTYFTCRFKNPTFRLSSLGNEKLPDGESIQAKIKALLRRSLEYWDARWKRERELMETVSK
jgi:hypothetical protein